MDHGGRVGLARRFADAARERHPGKVVRVILFGSVARGDDRAESDIDVLVVWDGPRLEGLDALVAIAVRLMLETGEYVSVKVLTREQFERGQDDPNPFLEAVLADGEALA